MSNANRGSSLTDQALRAMGKMVVEWARLEAEIEQLLFGTMEDRVRPIDELPLMMRFGQRLRLWAALTSERFSGVERRQMEQLIRRAALARERRDVLVHTVPPADLDPESIAELAQEINAIRYELVRLSRQADT